MKTAVRYYSRAGNTKKVAEAMASALGVAAETPDIPLAEPVDILFIGGALYAGNMDKKLKEFAEGLSSEVVKKVVVFSTAASPNSIYGEMKSIVKPKGIEVDSKAFQCRGKFLLAHRGRPNQQDLEAASAFAKEYIE